MEERALGLVHLQAYLWSHLDGYCLHSVASVLRLSGINATTISDNYRSIRCQQN
jgi:hypothetical protein